MVEMAVGVDRQNGFESVLGDEVVECGVFARVAVAGVDDDGFGGVVPDDVGVFLYRVELQAGYFHNSVVFRNRNVFVQRLCRPDGPGRIVSGRMFIMGKYSVFYRILPIFMTRINLSRHETTRRFDFPAGRVRRGSRGPAGRLQDREKHQIGRAHV